ncbi:MAG TPA: hypothetical protein VGC77_12020 [Rhodopseudomonas sp.]|uniref:hypothetical protein n=1 Tax=Rhodopseudomonas sp. TaxID=1078 RepID=UPI002ED82490
MIHNSKNLIAAAALITSLSSGSLAQAAQGAVVCDIPTNGIIENKDAGALSGPFLVTSLVNLVDPANPIKSFVVWTPHNVWFDSDNFKGPFFLEAGQRLFANPDNWTKRGVAYSGYSCR